MTLVPTKLYQKGRYFKVKSIRAGGVDFRDAFARLSAGNVELEGLYIPPYKDATYNNHEPRRPRRLLL
ncbi:hypothetical protein CTI14_53445, partial [Methylobacterium radiotolerans]